MVCIFHRILLRIFFFFSFYRLVSSLTEYSLDAPQLTQHLTDNFFLNYLYTHLIQIASFVVAFPMVYKYEMKMRKCCLIHIFVSSRWGRRWPTFCFFLIAEVCLLGSATVLISKRISVGHFKK